jgi:hypothetical protein
LVVQNKGSGPKEAQTPKGAHASEIRALHPFLSAGELLPIPKSAQI